jgi:hypothetical protein
MGAQPLTKSSLGDFPIKYLRLKMTYKLLTLLFLANICLALDPLIISNFQTKSEADKWATNASPDAQIQIASLGEGQEAILLGSFKKKSNLNNVAISKEGHWDFSAYNSFMMEIGGEKSFKVALSDSEHLAKGIQFVQVIPAKTESMEIIQLPLQGFVAQKTEGSTATDMGSTLNLKDIRKISLIKESEEPKKFSARLKSFWLEFN